MKDDNEITTIQVTKKFARRLQIMKNEIGCSSVEDLLERILKIASISDIKNKS